MASTGSSQPQGTEVLGEGIYIDAAPDLWIGDTRGSYRFGPDSDGFYWGLSGTATYPAMKVGCFADFTWGDDVTMNDVMCDANGLQGVTQVRQSLHLNFTLKSLFPLGNLAKFLRWGTVTRNVGDAEKVGIGDSTGKSIYWRAYFSKIYDLETGDFFAVTLHKAQFVDTWEMPFPYGEPASVGIQVRAFADTTKPVEQRFATVIRVDPSAIT